MTIELMGIESDRKVRYAIVGLGDIAQEDMMPGVDHTGNSEITALVTSDSVKADELGKYSVDAVSINIGLARLSPQVPLTQSTSRRPTGATQNSSFPP